MTLPFVDAEHVTRALSPGQAIGALKARLLTDPPQSERPSRTFIPTNSGELLVMPDESSSAAGLKLLSIARGNPALGLPAIQGVYLLMDSKTLTPQALLDAAALTCVRTAAVSLLAVTHLQPVKNPTVAIIGSGPQALAHARASTILNPSSTNLIARNEATAAHVLSQATDEGVLITPTDRGALSEADVIICCTTSREAIIRRADVKADAIIVAIGSHEPTARELATDLMKDSFVVVESRTNARREAGDVIMAESELNRQVIDVDLAELVGGHPPASGGVRVFKSVGDAWEDLTIAEAIVNARG
jgi:ornithine cyclodeaminase